MAEVISNVGKKNLVTEVRQTGAATNAKLDEVITTLDKAVNEKLIVDDITTVDVIYVGYAVIAADESAAVWKIKKLDETTGISKTLWADGNVNYDNIWTNRATTIVYS